MRGEWRHLQHVAELSINFVHSHLFLIRVDGTHVVDVLNCRTSLVLESDGSGEVKIVG